MSDPLQQVVKTPQAKEMAAGTGQTGQVEIFVNGVRIDVSPELEAAVQKARQGLVKPLPEEMTTTQAADFLDVSRPFVIKLIDRGELPCRMVGKHRRIPTAALVEHRKKMLKRAGRAADEMVRLSEEAGLYNLEGPPPEAR